MTRVGSQRHSKKNRYQNKCLKWWNNLQFSACLRIQKFHEVLIIINRTVTMQVNKGFSFVAQQPKSGLGRIIVEASRSHTIRHKHKVGLL